MSNKPKDPSIELMEREKKRKQSSIVSSIINSSIPIQSNKDSMEDVSGFGIKKIETKKRRKQILLYQSIHDRAERKCKEIGISMNEVINQLLEKWIDDK